MGGKVKQQNILTSGYVVADSSGRVQIHTFRK